MGDIQVHKGIDEYLINSLSETAEKTGAHIDDRTKAYVVFLLRGQLQGRYWPDEPLAPHLARAMQRGIPPSLRKERFRMVGDVSLIFCGLWWMREDCRPHRASNIDFYLSIGPMAYRQVDDGAPFCELSRQFGLLADLLARMGLTGSGSSANEIVRLFRIWEQTHNMHAARILADHCVFVSSTRSSTPS
ncbi:MAG TPA: hypothetical protein VMU12_01405 [Candidatus Paceibacterota bacterium]|nr:hypothetical protein [Candidatus Paceibacterota bacterium]